MLRQQKRNICDFLHQIVTDPSAFFRNGHIRIELDGFAEIHCFQLRCNVQRYKGNRLPGFLVVKLRHIDEPVLKFIEDVIIFHIMLREYHYMVSFLEPLDGILEGSHKAGIVVDTDGIGIVEYADGQRCDNIGQQFVPGVCPLWFLGPEILEGIFRNFFQFHHLTGAPGIVLSGTV